MTSESATECYVYITLPNHTAPVTAGRFTLTTDRRGIPHGRFVYGRSYLERPDAVQLEANHSWVKWTICSTHRMIGLERWVLA